jgi:SAM-dependent methyltransferase
MDGDYAALRDHARIGQWLTQQIVHDPRFRGLILDVGCGSGPSNPHIMPLYALPRQIDGVDPFPVVHQNATATRKWQGEFDKVAVPQNEYDALIAFNVVEHVANPGPFLQQAYNALKPGGRFYAITPCGTHPFAWAVRLVQALGIKNKMVQGQEGWNDYPAWYRLNSKATVVKHAQAAGFARAVLTYHANLQWEQYWPRLLRFVPKIFDYVVGIRVRPCYQILMFSLEKPGTWQPVAGARTDQGA